MTAAQPSSLGALACQGAPDAQADNARSQADHDHSLAGPCACEGLSTDLICIDALGHLLQRGGWHDEAL